MEILRFCRIRSRVSYLPEFLLLSMELGDNPGATPAA